MVLTVVLKVLGCFKMAFESAIPAWVVLLIFSLAVWELVWKGIALWKAGRNRQPGWFIAIFILNTAGILPIIYLAFFQKKKH